ncbi:hypothetical protein [Rhodoligotrophos defluvii]|uniref:hypothetical protein n=1 Tax=Rhodoligotrophos defluvii TaxID=2561934 RepID=UPI0010C956C3|nr:hypothetical protein [Rhodoligotrophos defluvii]
MARFVAPVTFDVDQTHEAPETTTFFDTNGRLTRELRSTDYKEAVSTVVGHVTIGGAQLADVTVRITDKDYIISARGETLALPHQPTVLDENGFGHKSAATIAQQADGSVVVSLVEQEIFQDPHNPLSAWFHLPPVHDQIS